VARLHHPPANPLGTVMRDGLEAAADAVERHRAPALVITSDLAGFVAVGADVEHIDLLDDSGLARLFTGRQVAGPDAYVIGLLDRLVPDGEAEDHARDIARQVAGFSVAAVAATTRCFDAALSVEPAVGLEIEAAEEQALFEDGEALEGVAAFIARRPPVFASIQRHRHVQAVAADAVAGGPADGRC
jgi:enoyl-CoA hydratase/carnithine racemase